MSRPSILKDKNPNWRGGKMISCPICGKEIWKKPYQIRHNFLYCSRKCMFEMRKTKVSRGEKHYKWKGDDAGYFSIHSWIRRNYGSAKICKNCGSTMNVHWANISHEYKRNISDFSPLCMKCHDKYDREKGWGDATKIFGVRYNK